MTQEVERETRVTERREGVEGNGEEIGERERGEGVEGNGEEIGERERGKWRVEEGGTHY